MRAGLIAILFLLGASISWAQAEWPRPNWERVETKTCRLPDQPVSSSIGGYEVRLVPGPNPEAQDKLCHGYLINRSGKRIPLITDWAISIYQGTGEDLFGDGHPSLVLEGYSGGAHCCYTFEIVDLGDSPLILQAITNETAFFFFKDPASKQFRIMTSDGAFDYFDGMCHACTPFPRVVLRVDRDGLHDVSSQFVEQYDSEIALARAKIAEGDIGKFLMSDFEDAKKVVLEIVFSYLYSGRPEQAWQALDEMWPAADRQRIKELIVKTKAGGLLAKLPRTASRPISAANPR